jgi:hypothetical protein
MYMMAMSSLEQNTRRKPTATLIGPACNVLALIGVAASSVSLFLHDWVRVDVQFAPHMPSDSGVLNRLGTDMDRQVSAIAAREVAVATAPTLWQYPNHLFQALFALLLLVAVAIVAASALSRRRVILRGFAFLSSVAAALLVGVTLIRITARIAALPAQIAEAMQRNTLVKQALAATASTPQVSGGPGWPLIVVAVGVSLALLGTFVGLLLALRHPGMPDILLARGRGPSVGNEGAHGSTGRATTVSDNGPAPDAHRDAHAL